MYTVRGHTKVARRRLICNNLGAPKWLFIGFLAADKRLYTRDWLIQWKMQVDPICPLCEQVPETINHLFFKCKVSAEVWGRILWWQGLLRQPEEWQRELIWCTSKHNSKNSTDLLYRTTLVAANYYVWRERNQVVFQHKRSCGDAIVRLIIQAIFTRTTPTSKMQGKLAKLNW
ncbi:hypothetical protein P3L10_033207 [Capsicum annuum]|uniref:uncharacterized protein LOC107849366 n=1 Tax=Capsicum annuum TaxID=4072 RepID=UPI001FB10521|nr:uncharacterized protein LOC107849366 [Capsicum annuum]